VISTVEILFFVTSIFILQLFVLSDLLAPVGLLSLSTFMAK